MNPQYLGQMKNGTYNGWTNHATWRLALEYFGDSSLIAEVIAIDVEDAVFAFQLDLKGKVPGIHEWTLRKELAAKLESWMDGYLDTTHTELYYDEGDLEMAEDLEYLIREGNTWEIALTNCSEDEVTSMMLETLEDCREYLDEGMYERILEQLG